MRKLLLALLLLFIPAIATAKNALGVLSASANSCTPTTGVALTLDQNDSTATIQLNGTFVGTVTFTISSNGGTYTAIKGIPSTLGSATSTATSTGAWIFSVAGSTNICAYISTYTSGSVIVVINSSSAMVSGLTSTSLPQSLDTTSSPTFAALTLNPGGATALTVEGATDDTVETIVAFADPTSSDKTVTFADATGTVMLSTLSTNAPDAANSVTGASNALVFEGATADGFEISVAPADTGADVTITLPAAAGTVMLSTLATNAPDAANSVTGASAALVFEGATADAFELSVTAADPTVGDTVLTLPNTGGVNVAAMVSTLTTNSPDAANSVTGASAALLFEGTADAFETSLTVTDPTADRTVTIPDSTFTVGQIEVTYTMLANGSLADQTFFLATRAYIVTAISEVHSVAGNDAGAVNLQVTKDTSTNAPGAGTDLLTNNANAGFDLKGTANTVQAGTLAASAATLTLAAGDRLAVDFAGTLATLAGVTVTVSMRPIN